MKLAVFLLVSFWAALSFAKSNSPTSATTRTSTGTLYGIYVGVDYMNLTDLKEGARHSGTDLHTLGLRVGYDQTPEQGFGFAGGARYIEVMSGGQAGDSLTQFFIPELNLTWAANRYVAGYAGVNIAVMFGSKDSRDAYTPQAGLQFGLMGRVSRSIALNIGYTVLNQTFEQSDSNGESTSNIRYSGFTTSMNYIF